MKILFLGDFSSTARAPGLVEAMRELGHTVVPVQTGTFLNPDGSPKKLTLRYRIAWKLGIDLDEYQINERLWEAFIKERPEIVWLYQATMIRPGLLRRMKETIPSAILVAYAEDDMYAWRNLTWSYMFGLKYGDVVFTTKTFNVSELKRFGAKRVIPFDNCFDRNRRQPVPVSAEERKELGAPVGFIGSFERDRAESMLFLAQRGVPVRIWGNGWEKFMNRHPNLRIEGRSMGYEPAGLGYAKGVCATDINLCFLRRISRDRQTGRTVEIPACKGFMVAERTDEHLKLFKENEEAVFFDSNEELLSKVRYYLDHPEERLRIAEQGYRRAMEADYSYHGRLRFLLGQVETFFGPLPAR
jgi:spore maturation protein CgeB